MAGAVGAGQVAALFQVPQAEFELILGRAELQLEIPQTQARLIRARQAAATAGA